VTIALLTAALHQGTHGFRVTGNTRRRSVLAKRRSGRRCRRWHSSGQQICHPYPPRVLLRGWSALVRSLPRSCSSPMRMLTSVWGASGAVADGIAARPLPGRVLTPARAERPSAPVGTVAHRSAGRSSRGRFVVSAARAPIGVGSEAHVEEATDGNLVLSRAGPERGWSVPTTAITEFRWALRKDREAMGLRRGMRRPEPMGPEASALFDALDHEGGLHNLCRRSRNYVSKPVRVVSLVDGFV
jgi:hypothetical protein